MTLVYRIDAVIAGVAHAQAPPAGAAQQQALQQAKPLAGRPGEYLVIGAVGSKTVAVGDELVPVDIAFVVISNHDPPGRLGHQARAGDHLAGRPDLLGGLVAAEDVSAGITRIGQDAEHARMGQPSPQQLAIPCAAIGTAREA